MSSSISTRTRQHHRSSVPLLSLTTTMTSCSSRISKSRTPRSAFPRSAASPAPSTASAMSAVSLASAVSFASTAATSAPSSPHTRAKTIAAVATPATAMSMLSFSDKIPIITIREDPKGSDAQPGSSKNKNKTRVVPWPSQLYATSVDPDSASASGFEIDGYLELLQDALSRQRSRSPSSTRP